MADVENAAVGFLTVERLDHRVGHGFLYEDHLGDDIRVGGYDAAGGCLDRAIAFRGYGL